MLQALIISYPVLVHASILFDQPRLQSVAIVCFAAGILFKPLSERRRFAWLLLGLSVIVAGLLSYLNATLLLLYLPPILFPLMMLTVFGRTLMPGREPLVTAIGEQARGPLCDGMRRYTRHVTVLWCGVFLLMTASAVILPWLEDKSLWSWFTNVISYAFVGVLFLGEFLLRKRLFPDHDHPGFIEYLRIIITADVRL